MRATTRLGFLKIAALGLALSAGTYTAASAGVLTFTWDPAATSNTTASTFSANNLTTTDWASIHVPLNPSPAGSISETGFLEINGFTLNGTAVSTVHTHGAGGWGMYESFTATSHLSTCSTGLCGAFDSITANVYVYSTVNGLASYSFNASNNAVIHLPTAANPVLVATESGPLSDSLSPNFADITSGVPGASVDTSWAGVLDAFFISPPASVILDLEQVFTNTTGEIVIPHPGCNSSGTNCTYEIHGGGGSGNFFVVPEPASLALLGFGLVALGLTRSRRRT